MVLKQREDRAVVVVGFEGFEAGGIQEDGLTEFVCHVEILEE